MYGILLIIFSVLSEGIIGILLGLVGGILAIISKPPATKPEIDGEQQRI